MAGAAQAARAGLSRVVVTGQGVICALGRDLETFSKALRAGTGGIVPMSSSHVAVAAPVVDFHPAAEFSHSQLAIYDRSTQFAILAARSALAQSGLPAGKELGPRAAVIVGCASGSITSIEASYNAAGTTYCGRLHPLTVPRNMPNGPAAHLSLTFGARGPALVINTACASGSSAVALGTQLIRAGLIDLALVGGTEACLSEGCLSGWAALRLLAPDTCRPFSLDRRGLVLGEGSGIVVIESLEHARARGAPVFGEIAGVSMNSDAHHLLNPSDEGQAAAITACLLDSGLEPQEFGYINAHGTATATNDVTETRAIRRVFQEHADRLRVSSTKSMHGHTLGAAGAIELIATLDALEHRYAPPTINFIEADPACDLNYVANQAQELKTDVALSNSFGFGGHNAVLAVRSTRTV